MRGKPTVRTSVIDSLGFIFLGSFQPPEIVYHNPRAEISVIVPMLVSQLKEGSAVK
jgi:hypothetical protein